MSEEFPTIRVFCEGISRSVKEIIRIARELEEMTDTILRALEPPSEETAKTEGAGSPIIGEE